MNSDSNPGFITRLQTWALHPLTTPMDMLSVVLTVILVTTVVFAWVMIMKDITGE